MSRIFLLGLMVHACCIVQASSCYAKGQTEPNLFPMPQHMEIGASIIPYEIGIQQANEDIPTAMLYRLADLTACSLVTNGIQLKLLDKMKDIPNYLKAWVDSIGDEGYVLHIGRKGRELFAHTEAGLFYGLQTYRQICADNFTRELFIADWPSFANRIVFDDVSRGPISKFDYVKEQIRRLAALKVNGLSLYFEHVYKSDAYPDFSPDDGHFTAAQLRELSAYAETYHMQLIGNFQSFGHFRNILSQPAYAALGETVNLIDPNNPKAKEFLATVIGEMCEALSAPYFHVNCDETFDLGKGKAKSYVDSVGIARYYADHIQFLYDLVKSHGKQLMIWGDVVLEHEEIIESLPKDIIYMTWEYSNQQSYDRWIAPFVKHGVPFMVCPGVLNSLRLMPDIPTAISNIDGFIQAGAEAKALGVFTTVWDEGGQDQLFTMDWYPVSMAAAKSWNAAIPSNDKQDRLFEKVIYGTLQPVIVPAWRALAKLRDLPLTYNMGDAVWWEDLLPRAGQAMLLNNTDVPSAIALVVQADSLLRQAIPTTNQTDLEVWRYLISRYKLILDTRVVLASQVLAAKVDSSQLQALRRRYVQLRDEFVRLWNRENQVYSLDYALTPYRKRIGAIDQLLANNGVGLADIHVLPHFYFGYWLLSGPFSASTQQKGTYSDQAPQSHPPKPGDFTIRGGQSMRWFKYSSNSGGVIPLPAKDSVWYAFARVNSSSDTTITASLAHESKVTLNGQVISSHAVQKNARVTEYVFNLPLKAGINYLLLKMQATRDEDYFTFRLNTLLPIINHKHTYTINPNPSKHEAD